MSRIEEAFKRVGRSDRRGDGAISAVRDRAQSVALEDYPGERPVERAERVERIETLAPERPVRRSFGPTPLRPIEAPSQPPASLPIAPRLTPSRAYSEKLVNDRGASAVSVEQYRHLAATLYQAQLRDGLKRVMVSSTLPGEGKTLTITNLALTLSQSYGHRVLLVDADLRSPSIHEVLQISRKPGLGEYLASSVSELPVVQVTEGLTVVPAGSSDQPIAALVSDRMKHLVEQASSRFDWILLDTPPVGLLSDANLLASMTDAVVFVVGASSSPYQMVQRAIAAVGPERVIGVVLNRASEDALPKGSYYYNYGEP